MYKVKNLTNSPYKIQTADGGFGRVPARGEGEFDIHPRMVQPYTSLGYLKITKLGEESKPEVVEEVEFTEEQPAELVAEEVEKAEVAEEVEPEAEEAEFDEKQELINQLKALGVKADKRSSVENLQEKLAEASK